MSAKWRALQHRHRYTYNAISLPSHFSEALNQTPNDSQFFVELKHFISLNSTYAQLEHIKKLASAFYSLLSDPNSDEKSVSCAVKLFVEILFLENSLPLHRTLASTLTKCKNFRGLIEGCFQGLCEEYGDGENSRNGKRRFCVSRAALSMMSTPKLGYLVEVVEQCALLVGLDVVMGLRGVINDTNEWSRPSPIVMEQCQEALSCMYYLLQRFPKKFYDVGSKDDGLCSNNIDVLEMIFTTVLSILKSQTFSRDCFVAASVSLCAAMQVCLSLDKLGLLIMQGIFHQTDICNSKFRLDDVVKEIPYKGDLVDEISKFSALSRLCLIRGILTAVSRTVLDSRFVLTNDALNVINDGSGVKTILYDAILPELFNYAENPVDGHSNFHTLTVIQICLQQIKTLLLGNDCSMTDNYDPIPEEMGARLLKLVWNNLEDPLSQTVKQVHLIFDLYLDIQSSLQWANGSENIKLFLKKIASDLLHMGPRCKGRYVPLASLTRRLGAKTILEMKPDLLFESTKAYIDDDVCCAVTTFLKCFLEHLRDECWSSDGADNGYAKYRDHCLQPFLLGLASGLSKLRSNLNTYAVPVLLELDVDSIFSMLALIGIGWGDEGSLVSDSVISCIDMTLEIEQKIAVLVSLLKVSRVLALMEGDIDWCDNSSLSAKDAMMDVENGSLNCDVRIKGLDVKVPVNWLILALTHVDESLRMDAAETLFLNPKTASLPSSLELSLMRSAVPLNMRCCSTAFQMKWNSLFRKFFSRVRTALERQIKQGKWKPLVSGDADISTYTGEEKTIKHRAEDLFDFTKWLSCFLFFSCYPSAPYERKTMAMELILIMFNVWPVVPTCRGNQDVVQFESNLYPYSKGFILPASTLLLVGSIVDSWDRLRESSFHILRYFPTPLPGISTPDLVQEAIIWAKKLICSPRVRESDAGALTLRLIFRKYVLELSWIVKPSCNAVTWPKSELPNGVYQNGTSDSPVVIYVMSLIDWLLAAVKDAENNLSEACKNSFVHGILLTIRYTFEELNSESGVFLQSIADMKYVFEKLLDLVKRITSLALWVVSADAWCLPDDMEDTMDDDAFLLEIPSVADASESKAEVDVKASKFEQEVRPSEQIVMVGCWLAMKEVSLLLGTIIRKVPLPNPDEMEITNDGIVDESVLASGAMLDLKQLETIGDHFLEVLLKMKHMGAIDKTRAGFTALCNRLLCSNDPRLCKLTELWMEQLMERTVAKGQTVDDLLRRSAGIPAAFIAFFLSEPEGTPKRLLPRALRWLIDIVTESFTDQTKGKSSKSHRTGCIQDLPEMNANKEISKIREEGVVPTVHAFNALRAAFNDTNLATDTSGFSAEALIISIRSFSSSHWEIRNSACLAYTALVRRMVGFLNVQKRESARRALTGLEFFHRYPALHSFLFNELNVATELLSDASSQNLGSNLENAVHPSLCPMLILLARLKPSPISSATGDALDPFLFMPFIRRCSVQSNFRIRLLASRALTGLVSNEKLQIVLLNIASELPCDISHTPDSSSTEDSIKGTSPSFNSIHGILLQLNSLVDNNCRDLADSFKKDMVLHELIQILGTRSWIGRPLRCPCPILNGCILKVLDNMLSIAGTCKESKSACLIWNLLLDLSSECLDLKPADYSFYFDPTYQELRKQAAISYFNCVYQTSKDTGEDDLLMRRDLLSSASNSLQIDGMEVDFTSFQERLIRSLSDPLYEVRIATLKWLFLFLKSRESSGKEYGLHCEAMNTVLTNINIQDTVMKLLVSEKHHKCMHYLLKILYTWNMPKSQDESKHYVEPRNVYSMDYHSVFQLWDKLVSLFNITRHAKTRQTLICCMGICIKQVSNLYMSFIASDIKNTVTTEFIQTDPTKKFSNFYDSINYFVDLIAKNSDASETANMRKAAAESMIASGLLAQAEIVGSLIDSYQASNKDLFSDIKPEEAVKMYARKILDLWLICIKLLEDEDANIRKRLALDVQKYLTSSKPRRNFPNGVACNQVEKVIELCFDHLSTIFGYWLEYLDYICCWVLNAANHANYIVSGGGDLVRHVFDKEIDNHHEEKLLICQICSSHLEDIPISKSSESKDLLLKWRSRFSQQLITFAHDHIQKRGSSDWIGGVGNHKDAFLPVYANLLVFYTLSKCILEGQPEKNITCMVSDVCALGDAINPFLGNPLICNLYMMVVKSHEKYLGGSANNLAQKWKVLNDSIWDEFNPYFLLK